MALSLNPYINLRGTARDALEFYRSVLGGSVEISEFSSFPDMGIPDDEQSLIMHGQLTTDDGFVLMVSDVPSTMPYEAPAGFSVSISGEDAEKLEGFWNGLSEGGSVVMPYETPPWGGRFGMLKDRFGVDWMVALNAS